MKLGFEEQAQGFSSGSQMARVWTERWFARWGYCPSCGNSKVSQLPPNMPVADFFCPKCQEQFELKSKKSALGSKVADGAYAAKLDRLRSNTNPNLFVMTYDFNKLQVTNLLVIPKYFFVPNIVERRSPLSPTARRAGWEGSNILVGQVPESGRVYLVRDGAVLDRESVFKAWRQTLFLANQDLEARGWLVDVMRCVDRVPHQKFSLEEIYAFEAQLASQHPNNNNVRPKIRQQLQVMRDQGFLEFLGGGSYRKRTEP